MCKQTTQQKNEPLLDLIKSVRLKIDANDFQTKCDMLSETLKLLYHSIIVCKNKKLMKMYYLNTKLLLEDIEETLCELSCDEIDWIDDKQQTKSTTNDPLDYASAVDDLFVKVKEMKDIVNKTKDYYKL